MKQKRIWLFLTLTTGFILILLFVLQIKWLIETAETEKRHFTQSVRLSLDLTLNQILNDQKLCSNIRICMLDSQCIKNKALKKIEWGKIDSLIKSNLQVYGIDCSYNFEVNLLDDNCILAKKRQEKEIDTDEKVINFHRGNIQIVMLLPDKISFITRRISPLFIFSILLIIMLAGSFIFTLYIYRKAEKQAELLKSFTLNMAHEFKTPVSVIGLAISRLRNLKDLPFSDKSQKYYQIIESEKNKIEKFLAAILDHAYLENPTTAIKKEKVEINTIINSAVQSIKPILEEINGQIEINLPDKPLYLNCNSELLISAISNILDNACKYSKEQLKIGLHCFRHNGYVVFQIVDNGIGISHEDIPFIFDKYFRVNTGNIHNIKGYGIGLSFVKEVVNKHGGKVCIESNIGKGSKFTIYIPDDEIS